MLKGVPLRVLSVFCLLSSVLALSACGKKGPVKAPLSLAPDMPQGVSARRLGDTVYLRLTIPAKSALGTGPYSVDRIEVYAVTIAPNAVPPLDPDILKPLHLVGRIEVRPPPDPDAVVPDDAPADPRPRAGDVVTFVETLGAAQLAPIVIPKSKKSATPKLPRTPKGQQTPVSPPPGLAPPPGAPGGASPGGAVSPVLTRIYIVRGVSVKGHPGNPSPRIRVPMLTPPGTPRLNAITVYDESSVTVTWEPPVSTTDEVPGVQYNVYAVAPSGASSTGTGAADSAPTPLNDKPLDLTTFAHPGAETGKEQCFVVRSVAALESGTIESAASNRECITPRDIFPPAAPKGLSAVPRPGEIDLIWNPNTEPDLGGYIVMRGETPGAPLQPLTPQAIHEPRYRDTTVKAGVTYFYEIVAVDKSTPPNTSAPSNRAQEIAQ